MRSGWPVWALTAMGCVLHCQAQMTPAHMALASYATATYRDAKGLAFTTHSPQAYSVVRQVYGVTGTISPHDNWRTWDSSRGREAVVTITNLGNGVDTFTLSFVSEQANWLGGDRVVTLEGGPIRDNQVTLDRRQSYSFKVLFRAPFDNILTDGFYGTVHVRSNGGGNVGSMSLQTSWAGLVVIGRVAMDWSSTQQWGGSWHRVVAAGSDGRYAYMATDRGNLLVMRVGSLWPVHYPIGCVAVGQPAFLGYHMAWATDDGRLLIVNTEPLERNDPPTSIITRPTSGARVLFPPVDDGVRFVVLTEDNRVHKVGRTGSWSQTASLPFVATTPPLVAGSFLYFGTADGSIACLGLNDLAVRWQVPVSTASVVGRLSSNAQGSHIAFRAANGLVGSLSVVARRLRWVDLMPSPIVDITAAGERSVFVLCEDRRIRGLDMISGEKVPGYPTVQIPGTGRLSTLVAATRDTPEAPPYIYVFTENGRGYAFCSTLGLNYYELLPSVNGTVTGILPPFVSPAGVAFGFQGNFGSDGYNKSWFYNFALK